MKKTKSLFSKKKSSKTITTAKGPSIEKKEATSNGRSDEVSGLGRKTSTFAMSMNELEGALAGEVKSEFPIDESGDYFIDITNNSYIDNLGSNWELLLRCATTEQLKLGEVSATNINPPLRRKKTTRVRVPRIGMGGHPNEQWKLCLNATGMSFEGGLSEVTVTPGKGYKVVPISKTNPLDMLEMFTVEDELLQMLSKSKLTRVDWERVGVKVGRNAKSVRSAYIDARRAFPQPRHWLATQKAPEMKSSVSVEEVLHLIKKKQVGIEVYWRKFPGFDSESESHTHCASTVKLLLRFGDDQGVSCSSFRNNISDGSHKVAGPFTVNSLLGSLKGETKSITKHLTKLLKATKASGLDNQMVVHSAHPEKFGWDSVEILVYANPFAMSSEADVDPESVTLSDLRSSFGSGWPLVYRVHQYKPISDVPPPSSSVNDKLDGIVHAATQYFGMFAGVGTPDEFSEGTSDTSKLLEKNGEESITFDDVNLGHLQPFYLNWTS